MRNHIYTSQTLRKRIFKVLSDFYMLKAQGKLEKRRPEDKKTEVEPGS
ncbi:hypothetical protein SAMN05216295_10566 [Pseudomonas luteola]|nr:hypothetical protein SAMN05216295_10566 [Pseudomonas zeshuii]